MSTLQIKDRNGTVLAEGDTVKIIKDLPIKGSSVKIKQGTLVKNIRLTAEEKEIEGRVDKIGIIVLKTEFLQKV